MMAIADFAIMQLFYAKLDCQTGSIKFSINFLKNLLRARTFSQKASMRQDTRNRGSVAFLGESMTQVLMPLAPTQFPAKNSVR